MLSSWTLDLMVLLHWLCFGLAWSFFFQVRSNEKSENWAMRVREADAANSLALRRWNFLLAVTSHHSNFMCTEEVAVSIHSLGSGTSHVRPFRFCPRRQAHIKLQSINHTFRDSTGLRHPALIKPALRLASECSGRIAGKQKVFEWENKKHSIVSLGHWTKNGRRFSRSSCTVHTYSGIR